MFPTRKLKAESWVVRYFNEYCLCEEFKQLPYKGGLYNQPLRIVQAFSAIRNVLAEYKASKTEEANSRMRAKGLQKWQSPKKP